MENSEENMQVDILRHKGFSGPINAVLDFILSGVFEATCKRQQFCVTGK